MRSFVMIVGLFFLPPLSGQPAPSYIPPPLRVHVPFKSAWKTLHQTLAKESFSVTQENRGQGYIVTGFKEYISGPLTEGHIAKIGARPKLLDADWVRVRFRYNILLELVGAKNNILTVYADIQALRRDFLGRQEWVKIPTNGALEEQLLTSFGRHLFGESFNLAVPKKGFWQREPKYLPDLRERIPRMAGPERPA